MSICTESPEISPRTSVDFMSSFSSIQRARLPLHQHSRTSGSPSLSRSMRRISSSGLSLLSRDFRGEAGSVSGRQSCCPVGREAGCAHKVAVTHNIIRTISRSMKNPLRNELHRDGGAFVIHLNSIPLSVNTVAHLYD